MDKTCLLGAIGLTALGFAAFFGMIWLAVVSDIFAAILFTIFGLAIFVGCAGGLYEHCVEHKRGKPDGT